MAEWSKNKVEPLNINGGQEYTLNDNVSLEELNAIANNSFYASDTAHTANTNAHNAVETANEALEQARSTGTRVTVGGEFQSTWSADTKANIDASNLSDENVESWTSKLGMDNVWVGLPSPPLYGYETVWSEEDYALMESHATSFETLYDFLRRHQHKTYYATVGALDSPNNVKTLLGNAGSGNYTIVGMRFLGGIRPTPATYYGIAEFFAIGLYIQKIYKGYIFHDGTNFCWSGWTAQ